MKHALPHLRYEKQLWKKEYIVVGIDEVGRGAFAGPLIVGAVVLKPSLRKTYLTRILSLGINDSKKLSSKKREQLSKIIKRRAFAYATASISVSKINKFGIGKATEMGVRKVVNHIKRKVRNKSLFLLIDAFSIKYIKGIGLAKQKGIIHGDCISLSIAAASIIAKVKRDSMMKNLSKQYPLFGFENHVGYGTIIHRNTIAKFGITEIHRTVFVRKTLQSSASLKFI